MNKTKLLAASAAIAVATSATLPLAANAEPSVEVQSVVQRWPFSRLVDVTYTISGAAAAIDIDVSLTSNGKTVAVPDAAISGKARSITNGGPYRLTFDPTRTEFSGEEMLSDCAVTLSPASEKLFMIVDLAASLSDTAEARISFTNEVVGANGVWGDYYKTNCVVLRRVKAGSFTMGAKSSESTSSRERGFRRSVTLTKDFYIGVFEVPQTLYKGVRGGDSAYGAGEDFTTDADLRPVARVSYEHLRSDSWSCTNTLAEARAVPSDFWIGKFRAKTGGAFLFDLPTEAQWEYACRAGTDTSFYNGYDISSASAATDANLDALGVRYKGNGGWAADWSAIPSDPSSVGTENGTARIGSCVPNAWGLYDMLGNADEWVLDWATTLTSSAMFAEAFEQTVDPRGPSLCDDERNYRVIKGGSFNRDASKCRASSRHVGKPTTGYRKEQWAGFRLCLTLE